MWGVRIFVCLLCRKAKVEGSENWYHYHQQTEEIKQIIKQLQCKTLCGTCRTAMVDLMKGGKMPKPKNWLSDIVVEICCQFCLNKVTGLIEDHDSTITVKCLECGRYYKMSAKYELVGDNS